MGLEWGPRDRSSDGCRTMRISDPFILSAVVAVVVSMWATPAMPRFESSRPSQPGRSLRRCFRMCEDRRHFRWLGQKPQSLTRQRQRLGEGGADGNMVGPRTYEPN